MKTTKHLFNIFWTNLKFIFWDSSQSRKLKIIIRDESFYEKDLNKRYNYSKNIGSYRSKDEFSYSFLMELEKKLSELRKKYKSQAQIVENIERYINWLKSQMPLNKEENEKLRLKVLCGPAMFGHLINEIIYKGYIETPKNVSSSEVNFSKTAQILKKSFYIPHKDAKGEVLFNHLAGEIAKSKLSDDNKKHISLPHYKE
ncbi:MAG: hypothetical protein ACOCUT_03235 [bacterium]